MSWGWNGQPWAVVSHSSQQVCKEVLGAAWQGVPEQVGRAGVLSAGPSGHSTVPSSPG